MSQLRWRAIGAVLAIACGSLPTAAGAQDGDSSSADGTGRPAGTECREPSCAGELLGPRSDVLSSAPPRFDFARASISPGDAIDMEVLGRVLNRRLDQARDRAIRDLLASLGEDSGSSRPLLDFVQTLASMIRPTSDGVSRSQTIVFALLRIGLSYAIASAIHADAILAAHVGECGAGSDTRLHVFATTAYEALAASQASYLGFVAATEGVPTGCGALGAQISTLVDTLITAGGSLLGRQAPDRSVAAVATACGATLTMPRNTVELRHAIAELGRAASTGLSPADPSHRGQPSWWPASATEPAAGPTAPATGTPTDGGAGDDAAATGGASGAPTAAAPTPGSLALPESCLTAVRRALAELNAVFQVLRDATTSADGSALSEIRDLLGGVWQSVGSGDGNPAIRAWLQQLSSLIEIVRDGRDIRRGDIVTLLRRVRDAIPVESADEEGYKLLRAALDAISGSLREAAPGQPFRVTIDAGSLVLSMVNEYEGFRAGDFQVRPRASIGIGYLLGFQSNGDGYGVPLGYEQLGIELRWPHRGLEEMFAHSIHLSASGLLLSVTDAAGTATDLMFVSFGYSLDVYNLFEVTISSGPVFDFGGGDPRFGFTVGAMIPLPDYVEALAEAADSDD